MVKKFSARLLLSALAFAVLGSACDLQSANDGNCVVTSDYKISCPGDPFDPPLAN